MVEHTEAMNHCQLTQAAGKMIARRAQDHDRMGWYPWDADPYRGSGGI